MLNLLPDLLYLPAESRQVPLLEWVWQQQQLPEVPIVPVLFAAADKRRPLAFLLPSRHCAEQQRSRDNRPVLLHEAPPPWQSVSPVTSIVGHSVPHEICAQLQNQFCTRWPTT